MERRYNLGISLYQTCHHHLGSTFAVPESLVHMGRMNGLGKRKGRSDGQANPAAAYGSKERLADEPASLRILFFFKQKERVNCRAGK